MSSPLYTQSMSLHTWKWCLWHDLIYPLKESGKEEITGRERVLCLMYQIKFTTKKLSYRLPEKGTTRLASVQISVGQWGLGCLTHSKHHMWPVRSPEGVQCPGPGTAAWPGTSYPPPVLGAEAKVDVTKNNKQRPYLTLLKLKGNQNFHKINNFC